MTEQDENLRQGRSQQQHEDSFKILEKVGDISLVIFVIYILIRPWL
jgi:hypothetical protein